VRPEKDKKTPPGKRRYKTLGGTSKKKEVDEKRSYALCKKKTTLAGNGYTF
jgi:hypothetical protein